MSRLIDADALIHELNNSHYLGAPYIDAGISIAIGKVCDAPTIEPEQKTGKWIIDGHHIRCDQCGMAMCDTDREGDRIPRGFCPNCGARMDGEKR